MNRTEAINQAIREFESALESVGFANGIESDIETETKPMFWQGTSPLNASSKEMFLIYNFTDEQSKAADNKSAIHNIYINFSFYTTRNLNDVEFNEFLNLLENKLQEIEFNMSYEPDNAQAQSDPDVILHSRNASINKIFC